MSERVDPKPGDVQTEPDQPRDSRPFYDRALDGLQVDRTAAEERLANLPFQFERLESAFQRRLDQKVEGLHGRLTRAFRAISALERRQNLLAKEFGHLFDMCRSALALAEQMIGRVEQLDQKVDANRLDELEYRSGGRR